MPQSQAKVPTEKASSYLQQLCKHWAHKFTVDFTPEHGTVPFSPDDSLALHAADGILTMQLTTQDPEQLTRLEDVVDKHLLRFAFRETLAIDWQRQ